MFYIESDFIYKNFRCVVVFNCNTGYRCGYVELPSKDFLINNKYGEVRNIDVHGGITYVENKPSDYPVKSKFGWIGFDCGHLNDEHDFKSWIKYFPEQRKLIEEIRAIAYTSEYSTVKTLEFCEEECKKIVDQLIKEVK